MIVGIGVDVVQIDRMEKSLASPAFWRRVFGGQEQQFLQTKSGQRLYQSAAANFAAKEAFLKAAGRGLGGFALAEIQLLRQPDGKPYFHLEGQAAEWLAQQGARVHVSVCHDGGIAQAFVVVEQ